MASQATILGMKVKQILRLYHQFGHLMDRPKLSADEIGEALEKAGLIEWVEFDGLRKPSRYRETELLRSIPRPEFESRIAAVLRAHFHID